MGTSGLSEERPGNKLLHDAFRKPWKIRNLKATNLVALFMLIHKPVETPAYSGKKMYTEMFTAVLFVKMKDHLLSRK